MDRVHRDQPLAGFLAVLLRFFGYSIRTAGSNFRELLYLRTNSLQFQPKCGGGIQERALTHATALRPLRRLHRPDRPGNQGPLVGSPESTASLSCMWDADAPLLKNLRLIESRYLQFAAEAYNLFDHPNLNNPVTKFRRVDFGRILNMSGNRTMQSGLRLVF